MESDVDNETKRIANSDLKLLSKTEPLVMHNVVKKFKRKFAVDHLSFGVKARECFGLIGKNKIF